MFNNSKKQIKNDIVTKFCFLDETGNLTGIDDPYFTIGLIKTAEPYYVQSKIRYLRDKNRFYDELKFNKLSFNNIDFAKVVLGEILNIKDFGLFSYTIRKDSLSFKKKFRENQWKAYEEMTLEILNNCLQDDNEIIVLIADHITTPKDVKFEVDVKKNFNNAKERLALIGVCRFDSKSNDLLQIVDLLIGSITYDMKYRNGVVRGSVCKLELVKFLKQKLSVITFENGYKANDVHISVDGEINKKEPSS